MKSELRSSVPPPSAQFVFLCGGASGKSAKRRRRRKKRAGFEEVPRLAAMTVDGNRLARRWARELRPYAGVESAMHVGGGVWSPHPTGDKRIFVKMSFRGAQRRGNPFSPCGRGAAWGYYGLPHQPAGWFAMTCLLGGGVCQARQEMIFSG